MKVVFAIIAILIIWFGFSHIKQHVWIAPNPIYPQSWTLEWDNSDFARALATPPEGYGWRRYDAWNNPPVSGESIKKSDFQWRYQAKNVIVFRTFPGNKRGMFGTLKINIPL